MYRYLNAIMVRASLWPRDALVPVEPDMAGGPPAWRSWLVHVLAIPGFAEAVEHASPVLAARARAFRDGRDLAAKDARRITLAVLRYLLRARSRCTPFGLFAAIAPARITGDGAVQVGQLHRPVARIPADWLRTVVDRLEREPEVWPHLLIQANTLVGERDGRLVLPYRANERVDGPPGHAVVAATCPVRAAMAAAEHPILVRDLADKLSAECGADSARVHTLLAGLVRHRLLITEARPAMTDTDPLDTVVATAKTWTDDARSSLLDALDVVRRAKARHDQAHTRGERADRMRELRAAMNAAAPIEATPVGLDVRLDARLGLPGIVGDEAARAASALARLAPAGSTAGWPAWHGRFLERFGPFALVPVTEAVDPDVGLGFPAGFRDTDPQPAGRLSDRDVNLLILAQDAALRGQREVVVDDAAITALAGRDTPGEVQPTAELRVRVQAASIEAVRAGEFGLDIVGVYRAAGTLTGRFLDLVDPDSRERMAAAYRSAPTVTRDAIRAQISGPVPHIGTEMVARSPQVLPYLVQLGECRPSEEQRIPLSELAVTADPQRLYLVWVPRRRVVEPVMLNAVEAGLHMLPIARFLSEAPTALTGQCVPFTWGPAASRLPFLPAIRHGRSLLSPARWLLDPSRLPSRRTGWREWNGRLDAWLAEVGCPNRVHLGTSDQRVELDLDQQAHRALLRAGLDRGEAANLTASGPHDADRWIGGHVHDIVIPLAATTPPAPPPRIDPPVVAVREHGRLPGEDGHLFVKVYGHPDRQQAILTGHLPRLLHQLDEQRCWFQRYRDPDPHLRIRLTRHGDNALAAVADWAGQLRQAGLSARTQFDTDYPETTRFGGPAGLTAAEDMFVADSATVLAHLTALQAIPALNVRALTAASLLDLAAGICDTTAEAMRWLITHTTSQPTPPDRTIYQQALTLANPTGITTLAGTTHGPTITDRWRDRRAALRAHRQAAVTVPLDTLLRDLLHLHHVRMIGPDLASELACLHLARAAALSWLARHGDTP